MVFLCMLPGILCHTIGNIHSNTMQQHVARCTMPSIWCCCACCQVYYAIYMVLLCMLPGVLCHLYGVAVHVAWCTMPSTLWCCCACCLVYYAIYMVLLCMLPGVLCHSMVLLCMLPGVLSIYSMVLLCMLPGHIKTTQCKMSNLSNLFLIIFQGVWLIQNFIGQAQREKADSLRLWDTRKYHKYSYIATTIYGICILTLYYSFVASTTGFPSFHELVWALSASKPSWLQSKILTE